ncbi:Retrovirus-related Pol polyprotein, partial [Mucuna pruriens]
MEFGDTLVQFNIVEAMKHPTEDHSLFGIDLIDKLVEEHFQLDIDDEDISNFAGDTKVFDCLGSVIDEIDYGELGEVHNLFDSEDDIIALADLIQKAELLNLLDQVRKYEDPKCSNNAEVQVAETNKQLSAQVATMFTIEHESAKRGRDRKKAKVYSIRKASVKSGLIVYAKADNNSDGFSGYMQIHIALEDQHKTTFTCPFGTFAYTHMPFDMCNAESTFQRCMTSIFSDLLQDYMEVFMDDFTVYADSFYACLGNLSKVLTRFIDTNLVLNFEKCHFMVTEGIVLGHLVSNRDIEVDKSKIDIITSLPSPTSVREVRSFLGHAGFYRRFIKNFSKIALPLSKLLQKDVEFNFDQPCIEAFQELKNRLTSVPILQAPNWDYPFELMCDASNSALGAVLGQRVGVGKPVHVIVYASRTMDPAQLNYTTTEKELLAIVFALDKFCSYLLGSRIIVFSDHAALRFLLKKPDAKLHLIRWMLLLQEFNIEIRDKKGAENSVANHLSRIEGEQPDANPR